MSADPEDCHRGTVLFWSPSWGQLPTSAARFSETPLLKTTQHMGSFQELVQLLLWYPRNLYNSQLSMNN